LRVKKEVIGPRGSVTIEEETLAKAHEFVWEMMREIDGGGV
jgi:hypothetical protein